MFAQLFMLSCVLKYTFDSKKFLNEVPKDNLILIGRFLASIWMHIALEVEERQGLFMMKYAVNHHQHFENP
jgi:hypothetical protein